MGRSLVDEKTLRRHTNDVNCLIKLNEIQISSGSYDESIRIWDLVNRNCLNTLEGHTDSVNFLIKLNEIQIGSGSDDVSKLMETA